VTVGLVAMAAGTVEADAADPGVVAPEGVGPAVTLDDEEPPPELHAATVTTVATRPIARDPNLRRAIFTVLSSCPRPSTRPGW